MNKVTAKAIAKLRNRLYQAIDEGRCEHYILKISAELDEYLIEPTRQQLLKATRENAK